MIVSFADRRTEAIYHREPAKRIAREVQQVALRKLRYLNNAATLNDLRTPPGNRLEALKGSVRGRAGQHSIRVNDQWRIVFTWQDGNAHEVGLIDYH